MDMNLTILAGRLAATPEITHFASGASLARLLITVRSTEPRRRIDVIPVVQWEPDIDQIEGYERGDGLWIAGAVQRRFWSAEAGRTSRLEVVGHDIERRANDDECPPADTDETAPQVVMHDCPNCGGHDVAS